MLALGVAASAASIPRQSSPCPFVMTAVGEPNGTIVQDAIGENRIGGDYPQGEYYFNGTTLYDSLNHHCLLSPTTYQFQCTLGSLGGATRFAFADDGNLTHDDCEKWLACPAPGPGTDGSYNIFSDAKPSTAGCELVTLRTGGFGCTALGRPASSSNMAPTAVATDTSSINASSSSGPSTTSSAAPACPTDLSGGTYQFPHLIVPTSTEDPDNAFGNSLRAYISPSNTTLFNFDIPASTNYLGTCNLLFLFPFASSLDPSAGTYYFSGIEEEEGEKAGLDFALLSGVADSGTTYDTTPGIATDFGKREVEPGSNYTVATFDCKSGQTLTISANSAGNVELDYTQYSARPSAIGLYIVPCA